MGKKRFFDDRLKYLSFIQNTSEKKAISLKLYPHIASLSQNKSYLRILDAGTGDGTIKSNVIKSFHKYHPYTSLLITGKEISYEDLKNTIEKMPDRFVEHPNLMVTMTNVKFSELGLVESSTKVQNKKIREFNLILKSNNSFDFHSQITSNKLGNFIKKNWGIEIDRKSRTSYSNPCIIRIYREDNEKYLKQFIKNDYKNNNYDLIIASQAYRAASSVKVKVNNVIGPLMRLLNNSGKLLVTHSSGGKSIQKILKMAFKDKEAFPNSAKDIIDYLKGNLVNENKYTFARPVNYSFGFKKAPDQTVTELFGHNTDAKWANIVYVGQIPDKDIQVLEKNTRLHNKVRKAIDNSGVIEFENEIFSIKKIEQ
ncbi:MAG: hypothetical protein ACJ0FR_04200 [Gammaproteobacteria bacterium]|nr:MAG: hypothetical protein CBD94_02345 [Gammaproteobacteria bacterium TMED234]|tara:strand:+ start:144 stop:1247 length:1104 start_codon:yes stop_codon:yes gene_type:complete